MRKPLFFFGLCLLLLFYFLNAIINRSGAEGSAKAFYQLEEAEKQVYYTFNILWEQEHLGELLNVLERENVQAVFFTTGQWLQKFPETAKSIISRGHYLGNGTWSQRRLILLPENEIQQEITRFNQASLDLLHYQPLFFRPPYGEYHNKIKRIAAEEGCITLLWSINLMILTKMEEELILSRLEERLHNGAIFLLHTGPEVVELLPKITAFLEHKGYAPGSPALIMEIAQSK